MRTPNVRPRATFPRREPSPYRVRTNVRSESVHDERARELREQKRDRGEPPHHTREASGNSDEEGHGKITGQDRDRPSEEERVRCDEAREPWTAESGRAERARCALESREELVARHDGDEEIQRPDEADTDAEQLDRSSLRVAVPDRGHS